ncbi:MAG TPA: malto-oligosyltrehalose synthase, partial [Dehalococcoidia bacterium]|nr:malto-oligosyltrehalose synthase [Dehalococcoidia bacterium]
MEKAIREAKVHTSWINPNDVYEQGLQSFIAAALADPAQSPFVRDALPFVRRIASYGLVNSLSQTLLKLSCPGVPDTYQGAELWNFSLVDPDNRRPVDFALRGRLLDELRGAPCAERDLAAYVGELLTMRQDGRIKLWLTHRALGFRTACPDLFDVRGGYVPLEAQGERAENAIAFLRRSGERAVLVVAPRLVTRLTKDGEPPLGDAWLDTFVEVKGELPGRRFRDVLTGATMMLADRDGEAVLPLRAAFATLPVAMLERLEG